MGKPLFLNSSECQQPQNWKHHFMERNLNSAPKTRPKESKRLKYCIISFDVEKAMVLFLVGVALGLFRMKSP